MERKLEICYEELETMSQMNEADRQLMDAAIAATDTAYAPYSHFRVGAAVRMGNGSVVKGSNQENVAYPSGLCAERTALFAASVLYPEEEISTLAIVARNTEGCLMEASPCGACRQVMAEVEQRQKKPLRLLVFQTGGGVRIFDNVESLLPFLFR